MAITQLTTQQIGAKAVNRDDLDTTTTGKAVVTQLIAGTGITFGSTGVDAGTGDVTINSTGGGGSTTFTTVEVALGGILGGGAARSGNFTITTTGLTSGKQVMIYQATGPYTGKGTLADEAEMDFVGVSGVVTSTTTIKCFWHSQYLVKGNFKFNYLINA